MNEVEVMDKEAVTANQNFQAAHSLSLIHI